MARGKEMVHKVQMTEGKRNISQMFLQEYPTSRMHSKICFRKYRVDAGK